MKWKTFLLRIWQLNLLRGISFSKNSNLRGFMKINTYWQSLNCNTNSIRTCLKDRRGLGAEHWVATRHGVITPVVIIVIVVIVVIVVAAIIAAVVTVVVSPIVSTVVIVIVVVHAATSVHSVVVVHATAASHVVISVVVVRIVPIVVIEARSRIWIHTILVS